MSGVGGSGTAPDGLPSASAAAETSAAAVLAAQVERDFYECEALYSVEVEDWWNQNGDWRLTGTALTQQRTAFVQCATAAGLAIPADASDAKITALVNDINVFNQLTSGQQSAVNGCEIQYQLYLQSIDPNV